jgi:hypothetical protein
VPSSNVDSKGNNAVDQSLQMFQNFVPNIENSRENCESMQVFEGNISGTEHEEDLVLEPVATTTNLGEFALRSDTDIPGGPGQESTSESFKTLHRVLYTSYRVNLLQTQNKCWVLPNL